MNPFEVKKSWIEIFYLIIWDTSKTGIFFRTNLAKNDNRVLKKGNALFIIFSTQIYSLEYKEAFYMHFRKFDPCGVKLEREGHIDPSPLMSWPKKAHF